MPLLKVASLALLGLLLPGTASAAVVSDEDIRTVLIGSWVNPPANEIKIPSLPARQIFHDNGTTSVYVYPTYECREPAAYFEATWAVVDGILITQITGTTHPALVPLGQIEQVLVVAVDANRIVLQAEDIVYVRDKSDTCYAPNVRKT